jgi:hypothetical protein
VHNPEAHSNYEPEPEKGNNATHDDLETLFQQESIPDNERTGRKPNSEQEDFNAWENETASSGSSFADKIRDAADRIATVLDNRAETKDARAETRAEKIESAKDRVRKVGGQALNIAGEIGIVSILAHLRLQ